MTGSPSGSIIETVKGEVFTIRPMLVLLTWRRKFSIPSRAVSAKMDMALQNMLVVPTGKVIDKLFELLKLMGSELGANGGVLKGDRGQLSGGTILRSKSTPRSAAGDATSASVSATFTVKGVHIIAVLGSSAAQT